MAEAQSVEEHLTYRSPLGVTADEEGDDVVRVCVIIPGLKKKFLKDEADNAEIDLKFSSDTSFVLIVRLKVKDKNNKEKKENYKYEVKQLPASVDKEQSEKSCKVDYIKGKVVIRLKKNEHVTWARYMSQGCFRVVDIESSSEEDTSSSSN